MNGKTLIKNALILMCITLIAGISLSFVYEITKDPIRAAEQRAREEAYRAVCPAAQTFGEVEDTSAAQALLAEEFPGISVTEVQKALDGSGNLVGYVLAVVTPEGYGGEISLSMGVDTAGVLTGMTILSMNETPGLGAKCTDAAFSSQFAGISGEVVCVKDGVDAENEIDAISGATITSTAVTKAVNGGLAFAGALAEEGN